MSSRHHDKVCGNASEVNSIPSNIRNSATQNHSQRSFPHILNENVFGQVHITVVESEIYNEDLASSFAFCVKIDSHVSYNSFCDDFGPMNLEMLHRFCTLLDTQIRESSGQPVLIISKSESKFLTNVVFLLGSYMILRLDFGLEALVLRLQSVLPLAMPYRDLSPGKSCLDLRLQDCWVGLLRAKQLSWAHFGEGPSAFDPKQYAHYDSPINADLHVVVPGKFVAMRGPVALPHGREYADKRDAAGRFCHRDFTPAHYAPILRDLGVRAVVRLCEARYDAGELESRGVAVVELPFEDCAPPPPGVAARFLAVAEALPGMLAVHGKAGLGRTGTLVALYMMKHHGFTARAAMGWLRIVRPGSVIGPQKQYLCEMEGVMRGAGFLARCRLPGSVPPPPPLLLLVGAQATAGGRSGDGGADSGDVAAVRRIAASALERASRSLPCRRLTRSLSDPPALDAGQPEAGAAAGEVAAAAWGGPPDAPRAAQPTRSLRPAGGAPQVEVRWGWGDDDSDRRTGDSETETRNKGAREELGPVAAPRRSRVPLLPAMAARVAVSALGQTQTRPRRPASVDAAAAPSPMTRTARVAEGFLVAAASLRGAASTGKDSDGTSESRFLQRPRARSPDGRRELGPHAGWAAAAATAARTASVWEKQV